MKRTTSTALRRHATADQTDTKRADDAKIHFGLEGRPMIILSKKAWGGAKLSADGKIKPWRRAKDASQKQRWRKSKRVTAISRKTAAKLARP